MHASLIMLLLIVAKESHKWSFYLPEEGSHWFCGLDQDLKLLPCLLLTPLLRLLSRLVRFVIPFYLENDIFITSEIVSYEVNDMRDGGHKPLRNKQCIKLQWKIKSQRILKGNDGLSIKERKPKQIGL